MFSIFSTNINLMPSFLFEMLSDLFLCRQNVLAGCFPSLCVLQVSDVTLVPEEEQRLWGKASTAWRPSFPFSSDPRHKKEEKGHSSLFYAQ